MSVWNDPIIGGLGSGNTSSLGPTLVECVSFRVLNDKQSGPSSDTKMSGSYLTIELRRW